MYITFIDALQVTDVLYFFSFSAGSGHSGGLPCSSGSCVFRGNFQRRCWTGPGSCPVCQQHHYCLCSCSFFRLVACNTFIVLQNFTVAVTQFSQQCFSLQKKSLQSSCTTEVMLTCESNQKLWMWQNQIPLTVDQSTSLRIAWQQIVIIIVSNNSKNSKNLASQFGSLAL